MSSSIKAAIHLGPNYLANLEVYKNTNFKEIQSLFNISQKLILEHSEEILNVNTIESTPTSWTRSVLSHDQVIQWTKAKVRVYSDSVLCLGKVNDGRGAIERWEGQVEELKGQEKQLISSGILSQDFRHCRFFRKIPNDLRERNIEPERFTDRIIFMSMFNDIDCTKKGNDGICIANSEKVKDHTKRFLQHSLVQETIRSGTEL